MRDSFLQKCPGVVKVEFDYVAHEPEHGGEPIKIKTDAAPNGVEVLFGATARVTVSLGEGTNPIKLAEAILYHRFTLVK